MAKTLDEAGVKRLIQEIKGANKNLNTPIPISTENTTESNAQNVKNIADYIEKAKAAGVANVNGMAVTCLIDNDYSGVGYLYRAPDDSFLVLGIITYDDVSDTTVFAVSDGTYLESELVNKEADNQVTSHMLANGAVTTSKLADNAVTSAKLAQGVRNTIVITKDTTTIPDGLFAQLNSPSRIVDIVFKDSEGNIYPLYNTMFIDGSYKFTFAQPLSLVKKAKHSYESDTISYKYYKFIINNGGSITTQGPCTDTLENYMSKYLTLKGYPNKSTLSPVLQEIDLTGTDAERKAKLDQFETDWKALTGGNTMQGARFVGVLGENEGTLDDDALNSTGLLGGTTLFTYNHGDPSYYKGIAYGGAEGKSPFIISIDTTNGSFEVIPLFNMYGASSFGISVDAVGGYSSYKLQTETDNSLATTSKQIVGAINEVNTLAKGVKAFGAIELKASDNATNKATLTAYLKILTDAGVSITNGYSVPVRITGNSQEYHGMLNIGTGALLSGVVTDVNENHHYPFNVSTTDGAILFDENNYFLEKTSNEVTEMLDAIKYSYTAVPFTDTTLSNKAQLEVFLSKVPNATVMHCTYKEIWAGTLHKINGDWYGLLVKNTNSPADNINVKLSADGTIVTSNSAQ
jgi:hypothetical protein|nr:MAG TPA: hypothetical protein [Caudoviricetes sp.]